MAERGPTIVQLVVEGDSGDTCYRMRWPAEELCEIDPSWQVINLDARAEERFAWAEKADLLVCFHSADCELLPIIQRRKEQGLKTLVEYGDNFYEPPSASPIQKEWSSPLVWQIYELFLREADAVMVTSKGLETLFQERTSAPITILRNHLHQILPFTPRPLFPFSFGWAGSQGHAADLFSVIPVCKEILTHSPHSRFYVMGNRSFPEFLDIPQDRLVFREWGTMREYYDFWKQVHVGIVPLLDTPYNRSRSDIKAVEIAGCGAVPLLPDVEIYQEFLEGSGLRPFRTQQELLTRLQAYEHDPEKLEADRIRAYEYVCKYRRGIDNQDRYNLYRSLLPRTVQSFPFLQGSGFHQVTGYIEQESRGRKLLQTAQTLLHQEDPFAAADFLLNQRIQNPFNADIALASLRVLKVAHTPTRDLLERAYVMQEDFPLDLRFSFFALELSADLGSEMYCWNRMMVRIKAGSKRFQNFYELDVLRLFSSLTSLGLIVEIGRSLQEIYSDSLQLRYHLSEAYRKQGSYSEALASLQSVLEGTRLAHRELQFLSQMDENVLATQYESLRACIDKE